MQYVILHNIRSAHNVGAIFRTSEGAGVEKIFLTGYTPRPIDRFGRIVPEIQKTSLGANELVAWDAADDVHDVIRRLQAEGIQVVAVELDEAAESIYSFTPSKNVAYVFGNEVTGVTSDVIDAADAVLMIPMRGKKESLNVATTAGVVLFHHE